MKTVEDENTSEGLENLQAIHKKRLNRSILNFYSVHLKEKNEIFII